MKTTTNPGARIPSFMRKWLGRRALVPSRMWGGLESLESRTLMAAPEVTVDSLEFGPGTAYEGTTATLSGQFVAGSSSDTHTVTIDWGDGTTTEVPSGGGTITEPSDRILIRIDYSYDTNNFFNTQPKRDLLESAAAFLSSRLADQFAAIVPSGENSWTIGFYNPAVDADGDEDIIYLENPTIQANEFVIYVGGHSMAGTGRLAYATLGILEDSEGSEEWLDLVESRGQGDTVGDDATDFANWGGALTFDSETNWHYGTTTAGLDAGEYDFLTVAYHEMIHVLGLGSSDAWANLIEGDFQDGVFVGPKSVAAYGGNVPIEPFVQAHWNYFVASNNQEAIMTPALAAGERRGITELDFAGLDDIGWDYVSSGTTGIFTATHAYADDGDYTITVTVTNNSDEADDASFEAAVANVAQTLSLAAGNVAAEGSPFQLLLNNSDPGDDTIQSWTINWGDGEIETINSDPNSATHVYTNPGSYRVTATATDEDGTYTASALTVAVANVAPTLTSISTFADAIEDTAYVIPFATFLAASDANSGGSSDVYFRIESVLSGTLTRFGVTVTPGSTVFSTSESLAWTPAANSNGLIAAFTIKAWDTLEASSTPIIVYIDVTAVNDAPSFVKGFDHTVNTTADPQTVPGWAYSLAGGPADESAQSLSFALSNDNNDLFTVQPSIAPDGTLTYTAVQGAIGTAIVTVTLSDNGGTANDGSDTSASQTFLINLLDVPPTATFNRANKAFAVPDTNFILTLGGNGIGKVWAGLDGALDRIELLGTDAKTTLTITTVSPEGSTTVQDIVVGTPSNVNDRTDLGTLNAKSINLGGNLTITGGIKTLNLGNVADQHVIDIGASAAIPSATFAFGDLTDVTLTSDTPIKKFTANSWTDNETNDALTTAWIGTLNIAGVMQANVVTTSTDSKGLAINSFTTGVVGRAGDQAVDLTLQSGGGIKTVKVASWLAGTIIGGWIGSFTSLGDLAASIILTDAAPKNTLGKLAVTGAVRNVTIRSVGNIGSINVGSSIGARFFAGVSSVPTDAGDFNGDYTIGSFTSSGQIASTSIAAARINKVTLGSVDTDNDDVEFGFFARSEPKSYKRLDTPGVKLLPLPSTPFDIEPNAEDDFVFRVF